MEAETVRNTNFPFSVTASTLLQTVVVTLAVKHHVEYIHTEVERHIKKSWK